jgi:nucleotide-binding universal stress UspA family protein
MFKKILVPLDGSDLAGKILPQVKDLATQIKAQVTLMTVGSSNTCAIGGTPPEAAQAGAPCPELPVAKFLEQAAADMRAQGVQVDWVYKQGEPAREIVLYADKNQVDLIALATHGAGEIAWVLGSVAKKVLAHATVAVLLLRVMEPKPPTLKDEMFYSLQTP